MSLGHHSLYLMCDFCFLGLAALCILVLPTFQQLLQLPLTLKMVSAVYAETLKEVQHMMWLNHNKQNYKIINNLFCKCHVIQFNND